VKYSQVPKGKRAARRVRFPLVSSGNKILPRPPELEAQYQANLAAWKEAHPGEEPELEPEVALLPLSPGEQADVLRDAYEFAVSRGVKEPKEGNDLYEYGKAVHTVARACVDVESLHLPNPEPFFDGGVTQILKDKEIGKDVIIYLADEQQTWQEECDARAFELPPDKLWALTVMLGEEGEAANETLRFLGALQRPALLSLLRFMASQLATLVTLKSLSGSEASGSTTKSESETASESDGEA